MFRYNINSYYLESFLVNCHELSANFIDYEPAAYESVRKGKCGPSFLSLRTPARKSVRPLKLLVAH